VIAKIYVIGLSGEQSPVCLISVLNINPQHVTINLLLTKVILWHCVKAYTTQRNLVDYESMSTMLENRWMATLFWIQIGAILRGCRHEEYSIDSLDDFLVWTLFLVLKYSYRSVLKVFAALRRTEVPQWECISCWAILIPSRLC
jgi:hypothetical protein